MKPADRALEIAVVGLGQAGGNLATELAALGYRALALNTAHTDLSTLGPGQRASALGAEHRIYVGLDGYDGAGADLNYGRECLKENAGQIKAAVASHCEGADLLLLTAGLGGGTGSAIGELVRMLEDLEVPMITLATLPNEYESGIAKVNAVRAVSDLVKQPGVGWIFADNSRLSQTHGGVSLDEYFEKVNSAIVKPLDALNRLNARPGCHAIRALDGEDFRALLLSTGVINYAEGPVNELSVAVVADRIRENLQSSPMMPSGFLLEEISFMGVVLEASEEVLKGTPFTFYEQLNEQLKDETGGAAVYMGVYRTDAPTEGGEATLRMIASTQTLPEGIQAVVSDARREGGTLRDKLQRSMSTLDLGEIEEFDLFKTSLRSNQPARGGRRPSSHNFAVPEQVVSRPGGRRASQPAPVASQTQEPDPEPDPAAGASSAKRKAPRSKPPASKPPKSKPLPSSPPLPKASAAAESAPVEGGEAEASPGDTDPPNTSDDEAEVASLADVEAELVPEYADSENDDDVVVLSADALVDEDEPESETTPGDDNLLDRSAEAASYRKLVSTFLRTDFDSTRLRVARRLDAALRSVDKTTRELAEEALERLKAEGEYDAFVATLDDAESSASSSA